MSKRAKKTKKTPEIKHKGPTLMDRLPNNHGEWLELCIKLTERAISDPPHPSEQFLVDQANRLKLKLEIWKKENSNESQNQKTTP